MPTMALSQLVTKTYGRRSRQPETSRAARTFDEVFRPPARTASTAEKWGTATFTKICEAPPGSRKRKSSYTGDSADPFSFDSDDDGSPKKLRQDSKEKAQVSNISRSVESPRKERETRKATSPKRERENLRHEKSMETKADDVPVKISVTLNNCHKKKLHCLQEDSVLDSVNIKTVTAQEKDKKMPRSNHLAKNGVDSIKVPLKNGQSSRSKLSGSGDCVSRKAKEPHTNKLLSSNDVNLKNVDTAQITENSQESVCKDMQKSPDKNSDMSPNKDTKKLQVFVDKFSRLIAGGKLLLQSGKTVAADAGAVSGLKSRTNVECADDTDEALHDSNKHTLKSSGDNLLSAPLKNASPEDSDSSLSECEVRLLSPLSPKTSEPSQTPCCRVNLYQVAIPDAGRAKHEQPGTKLSQSSAGVTDKKSDGVKTRLKCQNAVAAVDIKSGKQTITKPLSAEIVDHRGTPELCESASSAPSSSSSCTRKLLSGSRRSTLRTKAIYNPRQWNDADELSSTGGSQTSHETAKAATCTKSGKDVFDDFDTDDHTPPLPQDNARMLSLSADPSDGHHSAKVKVQREQKMLYTVVHNVKEAHECQEYGETQEFCDDIDYIMDGLSDTQATATRCLSAISLASKCSASAFRMHIRAHDTFTKIFSALHDAPEHQSLALCTSAVMFMMSRDHLAMHIDRNSLQLMLRLLNIDAGMESTHDLEYSKTCQRIHEICSVAGSGHGTRHKFLPLESTTPGHLAMETLLSLTSKQAGDWFKDSLRALGGLDQIINTVCRCVEVLDTGDDVKISSVALMSEQLQRVERCIRVLESVSYMNRDNQTYLLSHNSSALIGGLHRLLQLCVRLLPYTGVASADNEQEVDKDSIAGLMSSCLLTSLRLLLNITQDNVSASCTVGQVDGLMATLLTSTLESTQHVAASQRFDLIVLGIGLLTNLIEHSAELRRSFLQLKCNPPCDQLYASSNEQVDSLESLGMLFSIHFEAAKSIEEEQDAEIEAVERRQRASEHTWDEHIRARFGGASGKEDSQKGEWHESDSGLFWQPADTSTLDSSGESLAAMQACRQEAAALAGSAPCSQEDGENYTKVLSTAGKHMEDSIMAAYIALLIGTLIQHNMSLAEQVRDSLPDFSFSPMVQMLSKFLGFMNLTTASGTSASKSIQRVIEVLETC